MKILILGGDGYLGWPTAMYLSNRGHDVTVVDAFLKRKWELERGVEPLIPIRTLHRRISRWKDLTGHQVKVRVGDLTNARFVYTLLEECQPDAIVHYAEQPSAPFSMIDLSHAVMTQTNNIVGNLNLLFAIKSICPDTHLVKLGTMGEYGTPNIDIEEGFLNVTHNGRKDTLPFPKQPFSFYHLSKVHDSHNIDFCCRTWGLRVTDLNQGVVYGIETDETKLHPDLNTSFHYDEIFGTVLNRFCVEAVFGMPLTVYGKGNQTRTFLNIVDTLQCVELTIANPSDREEYRVFNQFTEIFSINDLARLVQKGSKQFELDVKINHLDNPRNELDDHYFNPVHTKLTALGLKPNKLSDILFKQMLKTIVQEKSRINPSVIDPTVKWKY